MEKFDHISLPLHLFLRLRMETLGLSDSEVATALGYNSAKVVEQLKAGHMRPPLAKTLPLARLLQVPGRALFEALLKESMPELLDVLEEVYAPLRLSSTEINLVKKVREMATGADYSPILFEGSKVVALVKA